MKNSRRFFTDLNPCCRKLYTEPWYFTEQTFRSKPGLWLKSALKIPLKESFNYEQVPIINRSDPS